MPKDELRHNTSQYNIKFLGIRVLSDPETFIAPRNALPRFVLV
jgi:hypothetical protein